MVAFLARTRRKRTLKRLSRLLESRRDGVRRFEDRKSAEPEADDGADLIRRALDRRLADVALRVQRREEAPPRVLFPANLALAPRLTSPYISPATSYDAPGRPNVRRG